MYIRTFPGFLAKNDRPDKLPVPIRIPSMYHLVGGAEAERFWCPVRALDIYLARTQGPEYSKEDIRLLRHPNPKVATTKGHVAMWIRRAVSLAYESAGKGGGGPPCQCSRSTSSSTFPDCLQWSLTEGSPGRREMDRGAVIFQALSAGHVRSTIGASGQGTNSHRRTREK